MTDAGEAEVHDSGVATEQMAPAGLTAYEEGGPREGSQQPDPSMQHGFAQEADEAGPRTAVMATPPQVAPAHESGATEQASGHTEQIAPRGITAYEGGGPQERTAEGHPRLGNALHREAPQARPRTALLDPDELSGVRSRWREIQAQFVDEPRSAVQDADALVANLVQRLVQMFAAERDQLKSRLTGGEEVSTEELRQGLQRYRSVFERLLDA